MKLNHTRNGEIVPPAGVDKKLQDGGLETARPTGGNCIVRLSWLPQNEQQSGDQSPHSKAGHE